MHVERGAPLKSLGEGSCCVMRVEMDAGTFEYSVDRRVGQLPYDLKGRRVESVFFLFASSEVRLDACATR